MRVRALEVEESYTAPLRQLSELNESREDTLTHRQRVSASFPDAISERTVMGRAKREGATSAGCSVTGGEQFCPPEPELSSGLSEEGSEVRATSHAGSFSSPLET